MFGSRAGWPEDRVLALVPLIDYDGWRHATAAAAGHQLVQASVSWAYDVWQRSDGGGGGGSRLGSLAKWSIRIFNSSRVATTCLDVLHPRRNLDDRSSVHGAVAGGRQATFEASASQPGTGALVLAGGGRLEVLTACVMPHPGVPRLSWGPSHMPWTSVRDALGTNEDFRLATEWACEEYLGHDECAKDVVAVLLTAASGSPTGMPHLVIAGLTAPSRDRGRVMMVMDIAPGAVASVAEALRIKCQDMLTAHLPLA